MSEHIFNVKQDTPDHRDHIAAPGLQAQLPPIVSLRPWLGPVKNQGNLGSCTAHAGTAIREYLYRRFFAFEKNKRVASTMFRLSPLFLYGVERRIEGTFPEDNGAESRTIFKALASMGCCLEMDMPYADNTKALHQELTTDQLAGALQYRFISYHRVPDLQTLKSVLASGYTATVGTPVYEELESGGCNTTGMLQLPTGHSKELGGHEMHVCGYDDTRRIGMHMGALDIQNSWGVDWGDSGHVWIPYDYFAAVQGWDFWTCHLGKPW